MAVSDDDWRLAINDASIFLDAWGSVAVELQWTANELFDVLGKFFLRWVFNGWLPSSASQAWRRGMAARLKGPDRPVGPYQTPTPRQRPGAPKRYEKSTEYCEFHGYAQNICTEPALAEAEIGCYPPNSITLLTFSVDGVDYGCGAK